MQQLIKHINRQISTIQTEVVEQASGVYLHIQKDGTQHQYRILEKDKLTPPQALRMLAEPTKEAIVIVANHIPQKTKAILRSHAIAYVDGGGNLFFEGKGLYLHIETNQHPKPIQTHSNRAFNKTGLKIVFQLLVNPQLINQSYRTISDATGVTIDTIGKVLKDLLHEKQIIKVDTRKYDYTNRAKLLEEWVTAYNRILKPKLKQQRYRFLEPPQNYKQLVLPETTHWSGAIAGELLSDYLIAETGILYTQAPFHELSRQLKLIPDEKGAITMIEAFGTIHEEGNSSTAHPILVYADLLNSDNPRHIETALKIYKTDVENYL